MLLSSRSLLRAALACGVLAATPSLATSQVFADEFDNGVLPFQEGWNLTWNAFMIWHIDEANGNWEVTDMGSTFGGFQEQCTIDHALTALPGAFSTEFAVSWNDNFWAPWPGYSHLIYRVALTSAGNEVLAFQVLDQNQNGGGTIEVIGGSTVNVGAAPVASDATVTLSRDASGLMHYSIGGSVGVFSGTAGSSSDSIDGVKIYVEHTKAGGPGAELLAETYTDYVRVYDGGLSLSATNVIAGANASLTLLNATPSSDVTFAYSTTGGGPTQTQFGLAELSQPIRVLPTVQADASGTATISTTVPAGTSGVTVWAQALDVASATLSNGIMEVIQ